MWKHTYNRMLARGVTEYVDSKMKNKATAKAFNNVLRQHEEERKHFEAYLDSYIIRLSTQIEQTNLFLINQIDIERKIEKHRKRFTECFSSTYPVYHNYNQIMLSPNDMGSLNSIITINKSDYISISQYEQKGKQTTIAFIIYNTEIIQNLKEKFVNENIRLSINVQSYSAYSSTHVIGFLLSQQK
ncbi:hypothetical protein [Paenibacillus sp. IHBB 10380]|uniref:hypothetical protein n=1 Tax=Paenibacillus sp. IHBB 10380 TaxID=1566358 RepID=UPI0005CFC958|nr:hypothetical protein [Paenibacillus sp. IHBB 10380]AJS57808.1 hypothetical protein UB51_04115 [Paenibacillus sp. IHBB 10380]